MSYQPGSQIDLGLKLCQRMDEAYKANGRKAAETGDTSRLYSALEWFAYNQRLAELTATHRNTSDPSYVEWMTAGSPTCGADWSGTYDVDSAENREDHIGE